MKKFIRMLSAVLLTAALSSSSLLTKIVAEENTPYIYECGNSIYEFPDKETYEYFLDNEVNEEGIMPLNTYYEYTTVYDVPKYNVWVGYHSFTPSWSKASAYTLSSGSTCSASGSYTYNGAQFTININYTQGVSITYPADASRYSKLGVRADVRLIRTKADMYDNGTYLSTYYVNTTSVIEKYISVVYQ